MPRSGYDAFAWFYDRHWGRENPNQIFTMIDKLLLPRLPAGGRILDLCCGAGQTSAALARRGFRVTGVDGSAAMLRHARRNAPRVGFILADARSFRSPPVYDGAVSTFDSLNHILDLGELTQVLRNAHAALGRGGLFLFDLNMEEAFQHRWQDCFTIVESDNLCVVRGQFDAGQHLGRFDVTAFRLMAGAWRRVDVAILERCYTRREVATALRRSGFRVVAIRRADRDAGLADHVGRVFFLVRKRDAIAR